VDVALDVAAVVAMATATAEVIDAIVQARVRLFICSVAVQSCGGGTTLQTQGGRRKG